MRTDELDYALPEELIAQRPAERRDMARLLVLNRADSSMRVDVFENLPAYLRAGDCLAMNDTRVIRARVFGVKPTGGRVEVFLLRERAPGEWEALVRPSGRIKPGGTLRIGQALSAVVGDALPNGARRVTFDRPDVVRVLEESGEVPLPPYIRREHPDNADAERYQTIYARHPGAVAAPTAGLHFTQDVLAALERKGVQRVHLTLHVGYGTFRPIQSERVEDHRLDAEEFELSEEAAARLNATRASGGRIAAVGTTATRTLETQWAAGAFVPRRGQTDRYIYPPYRFRAVDVLQTNFHLPKSSLLALVCAFAGTDFLLEAYRFAVKERFRFYSYGDAMLIL